MITSILKNFKDYNILKSRVGQERLQVVGLTQTGQLLLSADIAESSPVLAVFATQEEAKNFYQLAVDNIGKQKVLYYSPAPYLPISVFASSKDAVRLRASALHRLASGENLLVVTSVEALTWKVAQPKVLAERRLEFFTGQKIELSDILSMLITFGYERVEMVEESGQFAKRGGIVDIYPPGVENPLRLEMWGDEIDSLRFFDTASQRSVQNLKSASVLPVNEIAVSPLEMQKITEKLQKELSAHKGRLSKSKDKTALKSIEEQIVPFIEAFKQGIFKDGSEQFYYLFDSLKAHFSEYFASGAILLFDEKKVFSRLIDFTHDKEMAFADYFSSGLTLPGFMENLWTAKETERALTEKNSAAVQYIPQGNLPSLSFFTKDIANFNSDTKRFKSAVNAWQSANYSIIFYAPNAEQGKRLQEYLKDNDYHVSLLQHEEKKLQPRAMYLAVGYTFEGIEWPAANLVFLSYADIFGVAKKKKHVDKWRKGQKISSFLELKVEDYVVHTNHGIGIYKGVEKVTALGVEKDYLVIQYAGTDKLFVPTEQVERVQKYVGAEGHTPKLNKLGGTDWAKAKNRIKESVQEMAKELLQLYAERQALPGYAFPQDTLWQKEFEDAFPYEETSDQLRAIAEIKGDMEIPHPMDRLLCGDVGYGKTEVAMRAAFKAVSAGKQVAVLVPTTVLAQQHEQTLGGRFGDYPVKIAALSRFKSANEQKRVVDSVRIGTTDILIGTHRILSKDIRFKDLGLLIVDEEQRFGVAHKERLKQIKSNVDVLTLSATPIPRTLHMSLVSMRDMSIIETPPEDRLPVQTYVLEYNERVIAEAIAAELARGGQVFFVHNRVQDLRKMAERVQTLAEGARIAVAHGQMPEDEIEDVMQQFLSGEVDILITTTIIESGLDMPNVNTIIVDEADKMGLSQLYQLRGRVGRSSRQAYAYVTYRRDKILTAIAQKRLKAIRDFTELGSGFKIAMRDLELRGAGNILGPEQHGHIMAVGFDMYVRLLEEAVEELRGTGPPQKEAVILELPVSAFLPDTYVEDSGVKTEIYHKLLAAETEADVQDIREETEDRFGNLPIQTEHLFTLSLIRVIAEELKIKTISYKNNKLCIVFGNKIMFSAAALSPLIKKHGRSLELDFQNGMAIRLKSPTLSEKEILSQSKGLLVEIKSVVS